jgi:hypothetical protein
MKHLSLVLVVCLLCLSAALPAFSDEGKSKLASETGRLISGTVYKQSGITREGVITIRTASGILRSAPVYRYDFDILYGSIDGNIYSFLMADIAEMDQLPPEDKGRPVNIILRNGVVHRIFISSEGKPLVGSSYLSINEVDVVTDKYGENVISGGDIEKIVFQAPAPDKDEDISGLVGELGNAILVGKRDGLIDDNLYKVLENLQKRMKTKETHGDKAESPKDAGGKPAGN